MVSASVTAVPSAKATTSRIRTYAGAMRQKRLWRKSAERGGTWPSMIAAANGR